MSERRKRHTYEVRHYWQSHIYYTDGLTKFSDLTLICESAIWGEFRLTVALNEDDSDGDIAHCGSSIFKAGDSHASIEVSERLFLFICNSLVLNGLISISLDFEAKMENEEIAVNKDGDTIWLITEFSLDCGPVSHRVMQGSDDSSISYAKIENLEFVEIPHWSTEKVVGWLKSTVSEKNDHAFDVRKKYEKLWSTQSPARRTAVAAYGKDATTLREIFFDGSDEDRYLCAQNPSFGRFSDFDGHHYGILGLDEAIKWLVRDQDLVFYLFRNPHLDFQFIAAFFSSKQIDPYLKLLAIRSITDSECLYESFSNNTPNTHEKRTAIEVITEFILDCPFDSKAKKSMRDVTFNLFPIQQFLSCTSEVKLYLTHFSPAKLGQYEEQSFIASYGNAMWDEESSNALASIRSYLKSRVLQQDDKQTAEYVSTVCKDSADVGLRSDYFQHAPLGEIFYPGFWHQLPPVHHIFDDESSFEEDEPLPPTDFDLKKIKHIREFIADVELGRAIIGIAFQQGFYFSEKHFRWLKDFCKACDEHFLLTPSHVPVFGTGSATEVFESMAERVRRQYPREAIDPSAIREIERVESVVNPIFEEVRAFGERLRGIDEEIRSVYKKVESIEDIARTQNEAVKNISRIAEDVSELRNQYRQVSERLAKATRGFFQRFS